MNIRHKLFLFGLLASFWIACENSNEIFQRIKSFDLPSNLLAKAIAIPESNGVKILINSGEIEALKTTSRIFTNWNRLWKGHLIESGKLLISGDDNNIIEYSTGNSSKGLIQILVLDQTKGELYVLYADGIM